MLREGAWFYSGFRSALAFVGKNCLELKHVFVNTKKVELTHAQLQITEPKD